MKPEHTLEVYLQREAKKRDILCYKFTSPAQAGVPDRILIGNRHVLFVELKAPGEEPRPLQAAVIARMRQHGAGVQVIDERDAAKLLLDHIIGEPGTILDTAPLSEILTGVPRNKATEPTTRPEHKIETDFKKYAKLMGGLTFKFTSPSRTGVPDQILLWKGEVIFVELKAPGKLPRPQQQLIFDEMKAHGAGPIVIDSFEKTRTLFDYLNNN